MIEEEGGCSYHYKWNETLARWELFVVVCQDGFEPDFDKIAGVPIADGQKAPNIIRLTTPKQPVTPGLSVTVTEAMGLGDNQFEVVYGLTKVPNALDNGTIRDGERWKPLRGLPTKLRTGDQDLATDLDTFDYNFNLPDNAVVRGIKVDVKRQTESLSDTVAADSGQLFLRRWWDATKRVGVIGAWAKALYSDYDLSNITVESTFDGLLQFYSDLEINADQSVMLAQSVAHNDGTANKGLARSTDKGETWSQVGAASSTIPGTYGWDLPMRYLDDGKFWTFEVITFNATAKAWNSTDGATWTEVSTSNILLLSGCINDIFYWTVSNRYYMATGASAIGPKYGFRTSTDGNTWSNVTGTDSPTTNWISGREQGNYESHGYGKFIAANGTALLVIAAPAILYRTTSTGADPTLAQVTTTGFDTLTNIVHANGIFILGTESGIHRSTDNGATFGSVIDITGGETNKKVWSLTYNSTWQRWMADVGGDGGTSRWYYSDDDGVTWNAGAENTSGNVALNMITYDIT